MQLTKNLAKALPCPLRHGWLVEDALVVFGICQSETGFPWDFQPDIPVAVRVHPLDAWHPKVGTVGKQLEELPFSGEPLRASTVSATKAVR